MKCPAIKAANLRAIARNPQAYWSVWELIGKQKYPVMDRSQLGWYILENKGIFCHGSKKLILPQGQLPKKLRRKS